MKYMAYICEKCFVEFPLRPCGASAVAIIGWRRRSPTSGSSVLPSPRLLLDMTLKGRAHSLFFESYVLLRPGLTPLEIAISERIE